jgi:DNA-binding MarR family transcriptional regulator
MSAGKKNERFGPVPLRACRDERLGRLHFRILIAIAGHDRIGKNGQGCWLSQNKLAAVVHCSKSHLSNALATLRDLGYISSQVNPDKRWFRIHRIVYTDEDFDCLKSVHSPVNSFDESVHNSSKISSQNEQNQFTAQKKTPADSAACEARTIVSTIARTIGDTAEVSVAGPHCAEAHNRRSQNVVADTLTYLDECERIAASDDRDILRTPLERVRLKQIRDDAVLPEKLNDRAAALLSLIGEAK